MTTLPRIATAGELVKLRSDNQSSRLYLTVHSPATVYTARLAAVPASTDKVAEITYNTGSGTLANVLQDMTLLVGSTAGAYDVGIARIRKDGTTTAGTFYIGETSEINWTSNAYLTVLDSFELWPRHVRINPSDGTTPLMDYDVAYTNQNLAAGSIPTPIMGSHAVLWLSGPSVTYSPDASDSWVNGGTITDYLWTCATADSITDDDTATPTFVFDTAGTHRIALTVTGDNAVTFTGYRYVFVVTEASGVTTQFALESCAGDYDTGGWTYRVTLYDEATQSLIRDRALCILHSVDYYGDTLGSVGYVAGSENVVAVGWISGESIVWASEDKAGSVAFDVQGPQYWLGQMTAFPSGVKDVSDSTTPNKWTKFQALTLNKCWYHFMRWRCTATRCLDVYPIDDTRRVKRLESPGGQNIWTQLTEIAKRSILAEPCADRYGRLFLQINQQYVSDRSAMPTVQAITSQDWRGEITLDRAIVDSTSLVDLSGVAWDGATSQSYFSLAPGHVFNHYGAVEVVDRLALIDQSTSNTLAGLYSARQNNTYPKIDLQLGANNRLIDIAPYQRVTLAVSSGDTVRGATEALTLIPRGVSYGYQDGYVLTDVMCEAEIMAALAVTGDTPPDPPDPPIIPIDPPIDPPPIDPVLPSDAKSVWMFASDAIYYSDDFFLGGQPTWVKVEGAMPDAGTLLRGVVAVDGSSVYLAYKNGDNTGIYQCTNPKAAVPVWTDILAGEKYNVHYLYSYGQNFDMGIWKSTLWAVAWAEGEDVFSAYHYGVYNGATWAWYGRATIMDYTGAIPKTYGLATSSFGDIYYDLGTYAVIHDGNNTNDASDTLWSFSATSQVCLNDNRSNRAVKYLFTPRNGQRVGGSLSDFQESAYIFAATVNGSIDGNKVFVINTRLDSLTHNGEIWIGDTTTGVALKTQWLYAQRVHDARLAGGGPLVVTLKGVASNNEFARISRDGTGDTASWESMTGNFWSVASGDQTFVNSGITFA
ncbi:MAG: hypothetical protein IPO08_20440 [Xanthomonadales bacterium]|nr:hypothetical protein [Xanthomonadales bacterium]